MNKEQVEIIFDSLFEKYFNLQMLSVCTIDGFGLVHKSSWMHSLELDRISAITSSLVSLGNASSKQIVGGALYSTIVETDQGNLLIKKINVGQKDWVLSLVANKKMLLGEANYVISLCAKSLSELS